MVTTEVATRRRGAKAERTRQRILEAAARLFRDEGYNSAHQSDVAAAAGMRVGSIYYHFPSKDALVDEILRASVQLLHSHVRAAVKAMPSEATDFERLRVAYSAHATAVLESVDYAAASARIIGQVPSQLRRRHLQDQRRYAGYWLELLSAAQDSGEINRELDPRLVRLLLMGATNATTDWLAAHQPAEAIIAALDKMFFESLRPPVDSQVP